MTIPSTLDPDLLYLFVVGPGTGETVILRVPPDKWAVIDSFKCGARKVAAATSVITKYKAMVAAIVLTHPHRDHYPGIVDLIDDHPDAVIGCVHPRAVEPGGVPEDSMRELKEGAKATYVRIWREWESNLARRWQTFRNETLSIGEATVRSLHPARPLSAKHWSKDANEISSAMLLEWRGLKLLLGADVPNTQWPEIAQSFPSLEQHHAMKVPHHGSREAIHVSYGNGASSRCWIVTPFEKSRLPSAQDGNPDTEGLELALGFVGEVHLTALPFPHDCEHIPDFTTTRAAIRDDVRPHGLPRRAKPLTDSLNALDRHVIAAFDQNGQVKQLLHGLGSVLVQP